MMGSGESARVSDTHLRLMALTAAFLSIFLVSAFIRPPSSPPSKHATAASENELREFVERIGGEYNLMSRPIRFSNDFASSPLVADLQRHGLNIE